MFTNSPGANPRRSLSQKLYHRVIAEPRKSIGWRRYQKLIGTGCTICCAAAVLCFSPATEAGTTRTVAMANNGGTAGPGSPTFSTLGKYVIDASGAVTFIGYGTDSPTGSDIFPGLWSDKTSTTQSLISWGDAVPGLGDASIFLSETQWDVNNDGWATIQASLSGTGIDNTNDEAILFATPYATGVLIQKGQAIPGANPGDSFKAFSIKNANTTENLHFSATKQDDEYGLWTYDNGVATNMLSTDTPAPGAFSGAKFVWFNLLKKDDTVSSDVFAFHAGIKDELGNFAGTGVWSIVAGSIQKVALAGEQAPGTDAGTVFKPFASILFAGHSQSPQNDQDGNAAFYARLSDTGGGNVANDSGLWVQWDGVLSLVAREGDAAPEVAPGSQFKAVLASNSSMLFNDSDELAFSAIVTNPNDTFPFNNPTLGSLWIQDPVSRTLVLAEGASAPGTETGTTIGNNIELIDFTNTGKILFNAFLAGTGINTANDESLWLTDRLGNLTLIAREGDLFDVDDDPITEDLRTIEWIDSTAQMNEAGDIAVTLRFTDDSSGIFVISTMLDGDLNGDGFVGVDDLNIVLLNWNQDVSPGDPQFGDANGDGFVGVDDLNQVLVNWNNGTPPTVAAIPEPGTLGLLAIGACGALRRRRA